MQAFIRQVIAACAFGLLAQAGLAADSGPEKAIRERIAALEKAWEQGDVEEIAGRVWGSDAVIHGEGQPAVVDTPEGVRETVKHLLADTKKVKLDIHSIRRLAPDAVLTWVTWQVTPKAADAQPFQVKSLFVWTRDRAGWRIRADMYAMGAM